MSADGAAKDRPFPVCSSLPISENLPAFSVFNATAGICEMASGGAALLLSYEDAPRFLPRTWYCWKYYQLLFCKTSKMKSARRWSNLFAAGGLHQTVRPTQKVSVMFRYE
jgi:hypothetical protein